MEKNTFVIRSDKLRNMIKDFVHKLDDITELKEMAYSLLDELDTLEYDIKKEDQLLKAKMPPLPILPPKIENKSAIKGTVPKRMEKISGHSPVNLTKPKLNYAISQVPLKQTITNNSSNETTSLKDPILNDLKNQMLEELKKLREKMES